MIIGLGSDVIDIRRMERTLAKYGDKFVERIFTPVERAKAEARTRRLSFEPLLGQLRGLHQGLLSLALRRQRGQRRLDFGHALQHALSVGQDRGLQPLLARLHLGSTPAPVEQRNVHGWPHDRQVLAGTAPIAGEVVGVKQ